uniref:Uncharacterized protein n=1 Tax=Meloidogyne enterolobii TaxID=390850 RepID=A0A6V7XMH2_MELEN|nr:unnamed protein product [Meloidogyne enterolobii]
MTLSISFYSRSFCFKFILNLGTCNNLEKPLFGAAFMPLARLREPVYDDKMAAPVASINYLKPSSREASRLMLSSTAEIPTKWNALLMQWGQFIAHDVSKTTMLNNQICASCLPEGGTCFPVMLSRLDQTVPVVKVRDVTYVIRFDKLSRTVSLTILGNDSGPSYRSLKIEKP